MSIGFAIVQATFIVIGVTFIDLNIETVLISSIKISGCSLIDLPITLISS